jgi:hypothetical protein
MRLLPAPAALCILAAGLVVQAIDLAPAFHVYHDKFARMKPVRFSDPAFADIGRAHGRLMMVPPRQCGRAAEAGYPFATFEPASLLVMDNRLETNNFRSGRLPRDQERYHCGEFLTAFPTTAPDLQTAYLFTLPSFVSFGATVLQTHSCDLAEDLILCRGDRGNAGFTARAAAAFDDATAQEGRILQPARSTLWPALSHGFERSGDVLRMTEREARIDLLSRLPSDTPQSLEVSMAPGPRTKGLAFIDVYVNGLRLGSLTESSGALRGLFSVSASILLDKHLTLAFADHSPEPIHATLEGLSFHSRTENSLSLPMTFRFSSGLGRNPSLLSGWSPSEPWGTWSDGPIATLDVPRVWGEQGSLLLVFEVSVFLAPRQGLDAQTVLVSANGRFIGTLRLIGSETRMKVIIPTALVNRDASKLVLGFDFPTAASPSDLGLSPDARRLAVGLKSLTVQPAP